MRAHTKAFILAAGFGTRLKPWTEEKAKPLIPVAGVESLFFALYRIKNLGIQQAFVNAHYKSEQINQALTDFSTLIPNLSMKLSLEKEILGTGGGILKIIYEEDLPGGLLILNGDTLASFDCQHLYNRSTSTFAISRDKKYLEKYKPVYLDDNNRWFHSNAEGVGGGNPAHFLGAYFLSADDVVFLKANKSELREIDLFSGVYELLRNDGRAPMGVEFLSKESNSQDFWFDLNNKEFFLEAKNKLSTTYFNEWEKVLALRHPHLNPQEALNFWPLSSPNVK